MCRFIDLRVPLSDLSSSGILRCLTSDYTNEEIFDAAKEDACTERAEGQRIDCQFSYRQPCVTTVNFLPHRLKGSHQLTISILSSGTVIIARMRHHQCLLKVSNILAKANLHVVPISSGELL